MHEDLAIALLCLFTMWIILEVVNVNNFLLIFYKMQKHLELEMEMHFW